ncbi:MAG: hypothetical protein MAG795_00142 [Candidatus Woesearchaeota archaeon]|nr:hypothetical protein [Candidatus Woesearchaeota archaeon]
MAIKDVLQAHLFLIEHDYKSVIKNEEQQMVSFKEHTGDGLWEEEFSAMNGWTYEANNPCCAVNHRADFNFCKDCGAGVNGRDVYHHRDRQSSGGGGGEYKSEDLVEELFAKIETPKTATR